MSRQTLDPLTRVRADTAMQRLAEFETVERYAIRCVVEAARAGTAIDDAHLEFARSALDRRAVS